jgi:hypothetical protein
MKRGISPEPGQEMSRGKGKNGTSQASGSQAAASISTAMGRRETIPPTGTAGDEQLAPVQQMGLEATKHSENPAKVLKAKEYNRFEGIKRTRADGSSYWLARELAPLLGYTNWQNFIKVINHAMIACDNSGHNVSHDFTGVSKIVAAGASTKPIKDFELSRYACYLIVQNGDPRKEVVALGQTYFAITKGASCGIGAPRQRRPADAGRVSQNRQLHISCWHLERFPLRLAFNREP